jgi:phage terminase small subunit
MEAMITFGNEAQSEAAAFPQQYPVALDATGAAIRAGYSAATTRSHGHRMITNDNIEKLFRGRWTVREGLVHGAENDDK